MRILPSNRFRKLPLVYFLAQSIEYMGKKSVLPSYLLRQRTQKIVKVIPYKEESGYREFGQYKDVIKVPEDFDEENDTINAMFYGSD